jgi:hypothetical protein
MKAVLMKGTAFLLKFDSSAVFYAGQGGRKPKG